MSIDSESERGLHAAAAASASTGRSQCEAKRAEVQRLREHLDKVRAGHEDEEDALLLALAQPLGSTDPLSCLCCCKFKRIGQSYVLHERRAEAVDGTVETKLVIVGPHWIGVLVTLGIVLVSTGMFLSQHVETMPWYDTAVTFALCCTTLYYLFQTTCTDPGIVRPTKQQQASLTEDDNEVTELEAGQLVAEVEDSMEMPSIVPAGAAAPRRRTSRRRYCDICSIEQDRSTDHCEDCGVCVAGYDHHCPWMGKCIGRGNMHAFKMFNVSWVVYVCFVLWIAISSVDWGHAAIQTLQRTASGSWVPVPPSQSP